MHMFCCIPGWDEIGYNFLVGEDGRVYLGRGWALEAAHTHGANDLGHGICILGDFKTEIPKSTAMNAAYTLVQCGVAMVNKLYIKYFLG